MLRLGVETGIGIGLATAVFFVTIWLGYAEAQLTGQSITFLGIDIFQVTNGNEIANNANMTWIGFVITGICIIMAETYRSARMKRRAKSAT